MAMVHQRLTDPRVGEWLATLENSELTAEARWKNPRSVEAIQHLRQE
jgi:hypothetical protein